MKRGWQWPAAVVGLLALNIGVCAVTVYAALSDKAAVVEKDYYTRALHWDDTMRQRDLNRSLGWNVSIRVEGTAEGTRAVLVLKDGAGKPIRTATLAVEAFHEAAPAEVFTLTFAPTDTDGVFSAPLPAARAGYWRFSTVVDALRMRFTDEQQVIVLNVESSPAMPLTVGTMR